MIDITTGNDGIALLSFNIPGSPVNVINRAFIGALEETVEKVASGKAVKGVILTSAKKDFIVGGDLNELGAADDAAEVTRIAQQFHRVMRRLETCGKPVVAAMNGTALGGGFEVALACHWRIAVDDPSVQIGLPEVTLGLLPGGGGTQRLPRIIGIQPSLQPLMEGRRYRPAEAQKMNMVDQLVSDREALIPEARRWILENGKSVQTWDEKGFTPPGGGVQTKENAMVFGAAAGLLLQKTFGNYPAPHAILNAVFEGLQLPFDRALEVETRHFIRCILSREAKSMIRTLFFVKNKADKGAARPEEVPPIEMKKVGVLGAGMMGAGIAYVSARAGLQVILKDVDSASAERGKQYSARLLEKQVSGGKMSRDEAGRILDRISPVSDPAAVEGCDLLVEAVFEDRSLKQQVYRESEPVLPRVSVLASNTSTLPITGLAEWVKNQEQFIGLHFFSPVERMPLVEIIRGKKTGNHAVAMCIDYARLIGKTPVVVNDGRGFFTSRVFKTYVFEGMECLAEGVAPALIENAAKIAGMPVGPLTLADEVSIELMYKINAQTEKDLGVADESASAKMIKAFIGEFKRPGKKAGKGFYEYPPKTEGGEKYFWSELAKHYPPAKTQPSVQELKKRFLHIQALEALRAYQENIVTSTADADLASLLGIGFPPYTGGVMTYIETIGMEKFLKECEELAGKYGERFLPPR